MVHVWARSPLVEASSDGGPGARPQPAAPPQRRRRRWPLPVAACAAAAVVGWRHAGLEALAQLAAAPPPACSPSAGSTSAAPPRLAPRVRLHAQQGGREAFGPDNRDRRLQREMENVIEDDLDPHERGKSLDMLGMFEENGRAARAFPNTLEDELLNAGVRQAGPTMRRPKPLKKFKEGYWERRDLPRLDPRRLDSEGILQAMSLDELEDRVAARHGLRSAQSKYKKIITTSDRNSGSAVSWKQKREAARRIGPRQEKRRSKSTVPGDWFEKLDPEGTEEERRMALDAEDELRETWMKSVGLKRRGPEATWGMFPPEARPGQQGGSRLGFEGDEYDVEEQDEDLDSFEGVGQQMQEGDAGSRGLLRSAAQAEPVGRTGRPQVVGTGANAYLLGPPVTKKRTIGDWLMDAKPKGRRTPRKDSQPAKSDDELFETFSDIDQWFRNKKAVAKHEAKYSKMYKAVVRGVQPLPWNTVEGRKSWTDRDEKSWQELGLDTKEDEKVQKTLEKYGIPGPNKLQAEAIPAVFAGRDIVLTAMTGCGKTLAFLMPILHKYVFPTMGKKTMRDKAYELIDNGQYVKVWSRPTVLIMAPSRELSIQTWRIVRDLLKPFKTVNCSLLIGESQVKEQDEDLKNNQPAVVIGSPGRILDHALEGRLSFRGLSCVVLDEIDRLLANSRTDHMEIITQLLKKESKAQTILVSATLSNDPVAQDYAKKHLVKYRIVGPPTTMEMPPRVLHLANGAPDVVKKLMFLRRLHTSTPVANGILVFVNSHDRARKVHEQLKAMHIPSRMLSANCSVQRRSRAIRDMDSGEIDMLVATDVATRGIDFRGLTHVVNFDIPHTSLIYAHRAGRCGRHGRNGIVISLGGGGADNNRLANYARELDITLHDANVEKQVLGLCEPPDKMNRVGNIRS
mmetsp:Transcript_6819/g.18829  ORF Transcript_6819/g.18829 Transcript_6819/m.18829 type:complete len:909 (-) Transcript_6819:33-2759(-)